MLFDKIAKCGGIRLYLEVKKCRMVIQKDLIHAVMEKLFCLFLKVVSDHNRENGMIGYACQLFLPCRKART